MSNLQYQSHAGPVDPSGLVTTGDPPVVVMPLQRRLLFTARSLAAVGPLDGSGRWPSDGWYQEFPLPPKLAPRRPAAMINSPLESLALLPTDGWQAIVQPAIQRPRRTDPTIVTPLESLALLPTDGWQAIVQPARRPTWSRPSPVIVQATLSDGAGSIVVVVGPTFFTSTGTMGGSPVSTWSTAIVAGVDPNRSSGSPG